MPAKLQEGWAKKARGDQHALLLGILDPESGGPAAAGVGALARRAQCVSVALMLARTAEFQAAVATGHIER